MRTRLLNIEKIHAISDLEDFNDAESNTDSDVWIRY